MYIYIYIHIHYIPRPSNGVKFEPPGLFLVVKGLKFQTLGGFWYISFPNYESWQPVEKKGSFSFDCHGATVVEPSKCTGWDIYTSKERPWIIWYTYLNLMDNNLYHGEMGGNHQTSISNCFLSSISIYIRDIFTISTDVDFLLNPNKKLETCTFFGRTFFALYLDMFCNLTGGKGHRPHFQNMPNFLTQKWFFFPSFG